MTLTNPDCCPCIALKEQLLVFSTKAKEWQAKEEERKNKEAADKAKAAKMHNAKISRNSTVSLRSTSQVPQWPSQCWD